MYAKPWSREAQGPLPSRGTRKNKGSKKLKKQETTNTRTQYKREAGGMPGGGYYDTKLCNNDATCTGALAWPGIGVRQYFFRTIAVGVERNFLFYRRWRCLIHFFLLEISTLNLTFSS